MDIDWSRVARWALAIGWFLHMNTYFGWNRMPASVEELAADGFAALLVVLAVWPKPSATVTLNTNIRIVKED
jgi:hypothetical protein